MLRSSGVESVEIRARRHPTPDGWRRPTLPLQGRVKAALATDPLWSRWKSATVARPHPPLEGEGRRPKAVGVG